MMNSLRQTFPPLLLSSAAFDIFRKFELDYVIIYDFVVIIRINMNKSSNPQKAL